MKRNRVIPILLLEIAAVIMVIVILLIIKFFVPEAFGKAKQIHDEHFEEETVVLKNETEKAEITSLSNFSGNKFLIPLKGKITSHFGVRNDPFSGKKARHEGTDIAAPKGTDILAAAGGTVSYIGYDEDGYGKYFKISHSDDISTLYAHCSEILVKKGEKVEAGQIVAKVGSTGQSTGNHLHFEIRIKGEAVNAMWYLKENDF